MGENMIDFDKVFPLVYPSPQQHPESLRFLAELLNEFEPKSILEIGTGCGALTTMLALSGARVVTIDIRDNPKQYWEHLIQEGKIMAEDVDITYHKVDSQLQETADLVRDNYDMVLLDADHSLKGGMKDWDLYSGMSKIVGIHDIVEYQEDYKKEDDYDWFPFVMWNRIKRSGAVTREISNLISGGWGFIFKE